jgi:ABC-type transporter Mla MlaB component
MSVTDATAAQAHAAAQREDAVIDLAGLTRFDSASLAALLDVRRHADKPFEVRNAPAGLRALAKAYGVSEVLGLT